MAQITADQARARAVVVAMAALVDLKDWDGLGRLFADRLTLDYTSLWGGEPAELSGEELVAQWRAMLPGFDATAHVLTDVAVVVQGDTATATADVSGSHLLDAERWVVTGRYDVRLGRTAEGWRIVALTFSSQSEEGDRALTERAKARVDGRESGDA